MRVPVYDEQQVAPEAPPDVRVHLEGVGAGAEAIGQGLDKAAQGVDTLTEHVERWKMKSDNAAVTNAITQLSHDGTTIFDGNTGGTAGAADPNAPAPSSAGSPGVSAPASDDSAVHEVPTGPSQKVLDRMADPASGLAPQGYFNTKGTDALKYAHASMDAWASRRDEIADALPNDAQKQLFLERTDPMIEERRAQVEKYASAQHEVALRQTTKAGMQASFATINSTLGRLDSIGQLGGPPATPEDAAKAVDAITKPVEDSIRGMYPGNPAAAEQQIAAYRQTVAEGMVQHYIAAKDPKSAQAVLDARHDDLAWGARGAGELAELQGAVKRQQDTLDGQQTAQQLVDGAQTQDGLHDMGKLAQSVLSLPPEKRTPELMQAVGEVQRLAEEADRGATLDDWKQARTQYLQGGYRVSAVDPSILQRMEARDPDKYAAFMDDARRDTRAFREQRATGEASDKQNMTFWQWMNRAHEHPEQLKGMDPGQVDKDLRDPNTHQLLVTPRQESEAMSRLFEINGQKPQAAPGASSAGSPSWVQDRVIQRVNEAFPGQKGSPLTDAGARGRVADLILDRIAQERALIHAKGGKNAEIDGPGIDAIASEALQPVTVKGTGVFSDDTVPLGQYETDVRYKGKLLDEGELKVPQSFSDDARRRLAARGINPTDADLQRLYRVTIEAGAGAHEPRTAPAPAPAAAPATTSSSTPPSAQSAPHLTHPFNRSVLTDVGAWFNETGAEHRADRERAAAVLAQARAETEAKDEAKRRAAAALLGEQ